MYLNVEPIHYGSDQLIFSEPDFSVVRDYLGRRSEEAAFGILLDDTTTPGIGIKRNELNKFVHAHGLSPVVFLLETKLSALAASILARLPDSHLRIARKKM